MDPNDILRSAGAEGLKALIENAQFKLGRFDPTAFREELCRLDDLGWAWARKGAATLLDVPLDALDKNPHGNAAEVGRARSRNFVNRDR